MSNNASVHREAFWMLCGERIGWGSTREVWSSKVLPDCVIKTEDGNARFQNVLEWETWQRVKDTPHSKWFAPCLWISPSGTVLVMKKTMPAIGKQYVSRLPVYLTDTKRTNYGMLGKQLVCHDYGTALLMEHGLTGKTRKVDWWDVD